VTPFEVNGAVPITVQTLNSTLSAMFEALKSDLARATQTTVQPRATSTDTSTAQQTEGKPTDFLVF